MKRHDINYTDVPICKRFHLQTATEQIWGKAFDLKENQDNVR